MGASTTNIIAFDTSAAHCAAAVIRDGIVKQEAFRPMARGQAESLMPILETLLAAEGLPWADLTAIGVGIGPGNFTGTRISVAAARGLALALGVPAIGVSNFEIMAFDDDFGTEAAQIISLAAPRGQAYVQHSRNGKAHSAPRVIDPGAPPMDLELTDRMSVHGFRAADIAHPFHARHTEARMEDIPHRLAKIAEWKVLHGYHDGDRPAPIYVRPADAAPSRDTAPVMLP